MARSVWQKTITDATGAIVTAAQVTVNNQGGGLATIYDVQSGGTARSNPYLTGSDGVARFYAEPGFYDVTVFKDGETVSFPWVNLGDNNLRQEAPIVFDNIAAMKARPLLVGQTALCKRYYAGGKLVDGLLFEIAAASAVDGYIDHQLINNNIAKLIFNNEINLLQAGVDSTNISSVLTAVIADSRIDSVKAPDGFYTAQTTVIVNRSLAIYSENRESCYITCPNNVPFFEGSGSVTQFVIRGISFLSGGGNSQVIRVLNAANWFESKVIIENCRINNFNTFALEFEDSVYTREIKSNRFDNCNGCMKEGWASDSVFHDNFINDIEGPNPCLHLVGGSRSVVSYNVFISGTGLGTGPDILIDPTTNFGRGGRVYVHHNKFGGELEKPTRNKVRVFNSNPANRSIDVTFSYNQMHGPFQSEGGTFTVFKLDNPCALWDISNNEFDDVDVIVDDAYASASGEFGGCVMKNNRFFNSTRRTLKLFENGGVGFTRVDQPEMGCVWGEPRDQEGFEARNRLSYSSSLANWNRDTGVTVTSGVADPYGGSDAVLVSCNGLIPSQGFYRAVDQTTGGAWSTNELISEFWAKAGTANQIIVGLRNTSDGVWVGAFEYMALNESWRKYYLRFNGLDNTKNHSFYIFTSDVNEAVAGNFNFFAPQMSENPSDYLPTPLNVGAVNTLVSKTLRKGITLGGTSSLWTSGSGTPEGSVTAPVGSLYTRTDGSAGTTLYIKESGTGNTGWVAK